MIVIGLFALVVGIFLLRGHFPEQGTGRQVSTKPLGAIAMVVGAIFILASCVKIVNAGSVGVVKLFGKVSDTPVREGLNFVNPFATVESVSIRTSEYTMSRVSNEGAQGGDDSIIALSKDGLPLPIDVTVTFRPNPSRVPWLFRNLGASDAYITVIMRPASRAAVRDAVSEFTAQEAYSSKREALSARITKGLEVYVSAILSKNDGYQGDAFIIQQVLVRNIELPQRLKDSIEAKLTAEQDALRMQYVLQKERQEAERKRVEGRGIADYQALINQGLTDKVLTYKGIDATLKLAESPNSKIVVVGGGKSGLPLILNGDTFGTTTPAKK